MTTPHVPELPAGCSTVKAAQLYAAAGWFVLPVRPDPRKNAGSILGRRWQDQTSRDPGVIAAWWQHRPDAALALHVGRSGAVAFDVDNPAAMPEVLRAAIDEQDPPFQSTRTDDPGRGHYVFAASPGRFGNASAGVGPDWGEVRGLNGVIVVEPTPHSKAAQGGRYAWERGGTLPEVPETLAACLRPPGAVAGTLDDAALGEFLAELPGVEPCPAVAPLLDRAADATPGTRHAVMLDVQQRLVRLGEQGHHGVAAALDRLRDWLVTATDDGSRAGGAAEAGAEFDRALSGAVRNALATPTPETDRGCCGSIREAEAWAGMGFDYDELAARVSGPQDPLLSAADQTLPVLPPAEVPVRSRLHAHVLDPDTLRGDPPPVPDYVLDGLVREGDLVALVSAAKAGKSLLVLERVLAAVSAGRRVVYLDAENGLRDVHTRVHALGYGAADLGGLVYVSFPPLVLDEPSGAAELGRFVGELTADGALPDLVVLDTASRFLAGEENDSAPWLAMYRQALLPLKRAGVAVLRLDHLGKDVTRGARGSSAKSGDVDAVFELAAEAPRAPGEPCRVELECTMQRSGDYEHRVMLVRGEIDGVLGHRKVGDRAGTTVVGDPGEVADAIVRALDAAEAPASTGREGAKRLVGEQFPTASAKTWETAVKRRKGRSDDAPAVAPRWQSWQLPTRPA